MWGGIITVVVIAVTDGDRLALLLHGVLHTECEVNSRISSALTATYIKARFSGIFVRFAISEVLLRMLIKCKDVDIFLGEIARFAEDIGIIIILLFHR